MNFLLVPLIFCHLVANARGPAATRDKSQYRKKLAYYYDGLKNNELLTTAKNCKKVQFGGEVKSRIDCSKFLKSNPLEFFK